MWSHISLCFFQHGTDVQSSRSTATRIPMSKGMKTGKAVLGLSTTSRSESQSMKIELRKSSVCSSAAGGGGKSWDWLMLMRHWKWIEALQNWMKSEQKCCNVKQSNHWHLGLLFWIKKHYCKYSMSNQPLCTDIYGWISYKWKSHWSLHASCFFVLKHIFTNTSPCFVFFLLIFIFPFSISLMFYFVKQFVEVSRGNEMY